MGLLDYFNQGADWLKNQPQMADPHANARALMGGQPMQYNQQPQSLIGNTPTTNNPVNQPQAPIPVEKSNIYTTKSLDRSYS